MTDLDEAFGWHLIIDLKDCDPDVIRSGDAIRRWVTDLCQHIGMKAFGEPWAERFGLADPKTAGYTVVQLIETSSITGHFSEDRCTAYLDIFSCKWFDPDTVIAFTLNYFRAQLGHQRLVERV